MSIVRSVLIVDDDLEFRRALRRALLARDIAAECAANAEEARAAFRDSPPDVALIDLHLGDGQPTGVELVSEARSWAPACAAFLMSGDATTPATAAAMMAGAAGVLEKPIDVPMVEQAFERWKRSLVSLDELRWRHVHAVLGANGGNKLRTARQLGCSRPGLEKMLRRDPPGRSDR